MEILDRILNWAVPLLCGSVLTGCITWYKMQKKKNTALDNGVQCLLRAEIIRNHDKYMAKGFCPIYARDALEKAYKAYHALHGNDVATDLYNETLTLPTEPQDGR